MLKPIIIALFFLFIFTVNRKITYEQVISINTALTTVSRLDNQCATSSDCLTKPVGSRACGGPNGYIIYSRNSACVKYIVSLAKLTTKVEDQFNRENSIASICALARKPIVVCGKNNTCVAQQGPFYFIA